MKTYNFIVEGIDKDGKPVELYQGFSDIDDSEEQARRALVAYCGNRLKIRPRKITLESVDHWQEQG